VASEDAEAVLHLVGGSTEAYRNELNAFCANADLTNRVHQWGYREDALRLLTTADVYVHTSPPSRFQESFGRSVVEAMAFGIPVVCFRSGALQEIVAHEETGLLCDESAASLASAIVRFLRDEDFRRRCGEQARKRYECLYSPTVIRPRWTGFLQQKNGAPSSLL
jgi:glycosyltransferase involved in cell wall biosynthesis